MSEIRFIPGDQIDTDKWDRCINTDPEGLIYSTSWYLDILGVDWDGLVKGDYETVMPLIRRTKFTFQYMFRPFGVQQLGITGVDADSPQLLRKFLEALPPAYRFVEFYTNARNHPTQLPKRWKVTENVNLVLNLNESYEKIYSSFSKNTKRNVKKCKKRGYSVFEHDPPEVLIRMFQANQGLKYNVSDEFYTTLLHIMHVLIHKRIGQVWTIHDETNTAIAGIFVMHFQNRATLLFSAQDDHGRDTGAMSFLINEYLIMASENMALFDFEGSNVPGLQKFYAGFGAVERNYHCVKINRLPIPLRWMK